MTVQRRRLSVQPFASLLWSLCCPKQRGLLGTSSVSPVWMVACDPWERTGAWMLEGACCMSEWVGGPGYTSHPPHQGLSSVLFSGLPQSHSQLFSFRNWQLCLMCETAVNKLSCASSGCRILSLLNTWAVRAELPSYNFQLNLQMLRTLHFYNCLFTVFQQTQLVWRATWWCQSPSVEFGHLN